jgi:hypothetical protein
LHKKTPDEFIRRFVWCEKFFLASAVALFAASVLGDQRLSAI